MALAWLGMYVHNMADLPNLRFSSSENLVPGLVWLLLFGLWSAMPRHTWTVQLLVVWGLLNLAGGLATVLPLPVWPFRPEQSVRHYAFHVLYGLSQLPVLALVRRELRELHSGNGAGPP
ncbi:MAG TPA: hypothetical protein VNA31_11340 [bacterium]|nr:hypothetical protein [bacterium]